MLPKHAAWCRQLHLYCCPHCSAVSRLKLAAHLQLSLACNIIVALGSMPAPSWPTASLLSSCNTTDVTL